VKEICLVKKYNKSYTTNKIFEALVGQGLVASEGEVWKRHRNLIMPSFSPTNVKSMMYSMISEIKTKLNDFEKNESLIFEDFNHQLSQVTLYIIVAVAFGVDLENKDELAELFEMLTDNFAPTLLSIVNIGDWFSKLPLPMFSVFQNTKKKIHKIVHEIIKKKKVQEKPKEFNELMSLLVFTTDEDGNSLSDQEIFDESMTFLVAGHDTTSSLLSFFVFQLAKNPKLQQQLFEEIESGIKNKNQPTYEEIENLKLMSNCIKESLRMFPPGVIF
jgi:cytochrome P450